VTAEGVSRPAPIIQLDQVSFAYDSPTSSGPSFQLRNVSLSLVPGELVAVIGRNGSGKSTLGRLCNGLLKPTGGRVLVNGEDSRGRDVAQLAPLVGYVFQNPDHQLFAPTVAEDVAFGPRNLGLPPADVAARVDTVLDDLGLRELAGEHPLLQSFAVRRLVALAGVLALGSPALVLDEPASGLDREQSSQLFHIIHQRQRQGTAVLLISHDFGQVAGHADRIIVLAEGMVVSEGPPRAILTDARLLAAAGLTLTPVARLAQLLAPHGIPSDLLTVDELASAYARLYRRARGDRR
jgi:energy-coupling factor transport system ATP-binding protein